MVMKDAYESMFGAETATEADHFMPTILPLTLNKPLIKGVMEQAKKERKWVLAFVIGTKPCFYKFYGSIVAAAKSKIPFFIINSNQHYDDILTHGIKEFNFQNKIASNLSIRGDLAQKSAELMIKISWFAKHLKKNWPGVTVIPVVLGDTIMTSIVPAAWMFSRSEKAIQNEAGLRSMTPEVMKRYNKVDTETFIDQQFYGRWILMRNEPFPEQWDTFTSAAGSQYHFAPVQLNKDHLLREGYPEENIWVIGGVVVDALELKRKIKPEKSIFSIYPQLEKDNWIRVDIHRRENLTPIRFKSIIKAIKELVKKGHNINFIEMSATRMALDFYGLRKELEKLKKKKNFLYTSVWPEYGHVIEFFESDKCIAALTDSGGVQEELNLIGKTCMTCRLTTDRPETVFDARSNIIVPPASKEIIVDMVKHIINNDGLRKQMESSKKIYGSNVGKKLISVVSKLIEKNDKPFKWAHDTLKLWSDNEKGIDYL
jgi:UDP-N-acetylglucosamine 2-epimerase (non-hydrolysing)|tara:strand:+ start:516 stop:1970 length:1455 start_codon:yes stop_codon:yes gene_type:complete